MIDAQIYIRQGMLVRRIGRREDATSWGSVSVAFSGEPSNPTWRSEHQLVRPADDDKEVWELFLPDATLKDTGPKVFKVGQVWAECSGGWPSVYRVDSVNAHREANISPIVGGIGSSTWGQNSMGARHSVLLFNAPAQQGVDANANPVHQFEASIIDDSAKLPVVPRGKDADCTAHGCDRIRELGVYANRAGLCTMHVAEETGFAQGLSDADDLNARWAANIRHQMRERPEPQLVVGGLWRTRPEGMR